MNAADLDSTQQHPPKILLTKIGMDGHDRGSRLVAAFLRDGGMEVVYTGPWQKITDVVNLAIQEDVDLIGISSLATDHLILPKLMDALRDAGLGHVSVVVGGIVPDCDLALLSDAGVAHVFHPGAARDDIVARVSQLVQKTRAAGLAEMGGGHA
ncbi:MAG: methylmalonyl-CoA mutase [Rhodospirillaceae bacterium]|mgnify:FL=1|jgi:methylmalonyl-CoA mutase C-terminal domain/subunit|nr:methylmalonyl-CoA mutase [Rhodospirillaceae bacterium]MBT4688892.1 methylmalonyl-CoA mutase [Rhodospirillaceae bacterium]MBT5082161.1 methylmalonyl-CoA mutase [Rhodospirillaceae bacterium]MBT5523700.1 methylmalonyl-CoA mutase [Rhodospirillaceae bacterium]MBT5879996.1 methylmalonyl-CoA mutase [Rhodospirillaceae bacterium]